MNRRELLVGSLACAGAAGLGAVAIASGPFIGVRMVVLYTGMRVHRISVDRQIVGVEKVIAGLRADVILRNDQGAEMSYSTTDADHIEELQIGAVSRQSYTYEVTQEISDDDA